MSDKILYTLVTNSGGVDGRDHMDKGGVIVLATFNEHEAREKLNGWCRIEKTVIDVGEQRAAAMAKLSKIDQLVLGLNR
jgi:hypothetical protein